MTEEKPDKPDIETIPGNTNILLIAPHGVETKPLEELPLDDIGTAELTRQIQKHLGCSAVINTAFRKPTGKDLTKRNHGVPDLKAKVLNLNLVVQASQVKDFTNGIKKVVGAKGLTYVFWIHGIANGNIEQIGKDVQCLLGYGQPNTEAIPEEQPHPTAEQKTIDIVLREFEQKGIKTIPAPRTSKYRGWEKTYMNQWFLKKYNFDQVQSIQLEFKKTGFRGKKDLEAAAKIIADAISTLVPPIEKLTESPEKKNQSVDKALADPNETNEAKDVDKAQADPNETNEAKDVDKSESIPQGNEDSNAEVPSKSNAIEDENAKTKVESSESKLPADEDIEDEEEGSPEPAEETPAQETALAQKINDQEEVKDTIDRGDPESKISSDEGKSIKVSPEIEIVEEDPKVEEAYNHLKGIFVKHIGYAMLESGQYLIEKFYGGNCTEADKNPFNQNKSLNQLFERLQTESSGNVPKKSWLYNSINLAIAEDKYEKLSIYGKLGNSHKLILIGQKKLPEKTKVELMEKTVDKGWTVLELQKEVSKIKDADKIELSEEIPIEHLMALDVKKLTSLKNLTTAREKKTQKDLTIYQDNLKKIEKAIKTKPKTPNIISVSRRTDIPAVYSEWFFNRIKEGFVQVRKSVDGKPKKVSLLPEDVRCFVFWTKDPGPMLDRLDELNGYHFYFQFTITPYGKNLEPHLPPKDKLVERFIRLSEIIGKERVIWRYDPILLTDEIDIEYHKKHFMELAKRLHKHTDKCIISFISSLANILKENKDILKRKKISEKVRLELAKDIHQIAQGYGLKVEACSQKIDYTSVGIPRSRCVDPDLIGTLIGKKLDDPKFPLLRPKCGCAGSIDIGTDETCIHGCYFCYATKDHKQARFNYHRHNKNSPLLIGKIAEDDEKVLGIEIATETGMDT